jgi:hypothetical protein
MRAAKATIPSVKSKGPKYARTIREIPESLARVWWLGPAGAEEADA